MALLILRTFRPKKMKGLREKLVMLMMFCAWYSTGQTVSYTAHDDVIANPERGFYHHTEVHSGSYNNLDLATLTSYRTNQSITQILRVFYLESFRKSPISSQYLNNIRKDMAVVRESGLKMIVRFAYSTGTTAPFNDATPEVVQMHIDQLKPVLRENADVIAVMQAGFIGTWGEWYYTDHFASEPGFPSAEDWENRRQVVFSLLDALPKDRMLQIRTPGYKMKIFNTEDPIDESNAFEAAHQSRLGHHNDCFVASSSDFGTYQNPDVEKPYLEAETFFTPMGGETCNVAPPYSDCDNSTSELERFHWSYLNIDYNKNVLNVWEDQGCFDEVELRLGYRYELLDGSYTSVAKPGGAFDFSLNLKNVGYSNPYNPRDLKILLRNSVTGEIYMVAPDENIKRWPLATEINLAFTAGLPEHIPTGNYELLMHMPDPYITLGNNPAYAIQMANHDVWETQTGYNNLNHTLEITDSNALPSYSGSMRFAQSETPKTLDLKGSSDLFIGTDDESVLLFWGGQSDDLTRVIEMAEGDGDFEIVSAIPGNEDYLIPGNLNNEFDYTFRYYLTNGVEQTELSHTVSKGFASNAEILINTDGNMEDWKTIPPVGTAIRDTTYALQVHFDSQKLNLNAIGSADFRVYLNADNSTATGYSGDSTRLVGMDYIISPSGVYQYDEEWVHLNNIEFTTASNQTHELSVLFDPLDLLDQSQTISVYAVFDNSVEILDTDDQIAKVYRALPADLPEVFEVTNSTLSPQTKLILAWSACTTCTGYLIERSIHGENFELLGEYHHSTSMATDENLLMNTVYFYRMQTFNDLGKSGYSEVISIKTGGNVLATQTALFIYPNPTNDRVVFSRLLERIVITDLAGRIVMHKDSSNEIDIRHLKAGVYIIEGMAGNERVVSRVIKQ